MDTERQLACLIKTQQEINRLLVKLLQSLTDQPQRSSLQLPHSVHVTPKQAAVELGIARDAEDSAGYQRFLRLIGKTKLRLKNYSPKSWEVQNLNPEGKPCYRVHLNSAKVRLTELGIL